MNIDPNRTVYGLLAALVLLVAGGLVASSMLNRAERSVPTCLRPYASTYGAALSLWTASHLAVPAEVDHLHPSDLRDMVDETDAEACGRLRAALPDSLRIGGLHAPWLAAFYQAGDRYVVSVLPRVDPEEIRREEEAIQRGVMPQTELAPALVFVFDSTGTRLAVYETW